MAIRSSAAATAPWTCCSVIGEALRRLREHRPLVHQITNYVVMNETANATLGDWRGLPVMAHAREEVEQMASAAGALVLNIGTLAAAWVGRDAARRARGERRGRPRGARSGRRRRHRLPDRDRAPDRRRGRAGGRAVAAMRPRSPRSPGARPTSEASSRWASRAARSSRGRLRERSARSPP